MLEQLLGKEVLETFEAPDYNSYIAKAAALLETVKGKRVNLKVVADKEGKYPDIPVSGVYVETHVPGQETALKYSAKELEAIAKMSNTRSAAEGSGTMNDDDLESVFG